jgi:hypothetical protein
MLLRRRGPRTVLEHLQDRSNRLRTRHHRRRGRVAPRTLNPTQLAPASTPTTRSNTPSSLESHPENIIPVRESPQITPQGDREIIALAESLRIGDHHQMSQTMPILAQVRVINPETRHMTTEDDVALY